MTIEEFFGDEAIELNFLRSSLHTIRKDLADAQKIIGDLQVERRGLEVEVERLRECYVNVVDVLQELHDEQNGPPQSSP